MRIQRAEEVKQKTYSIVEMQAGEVYKHPKMPHLYMRIDDDGAFSVLSLASGKFVTLPGETLHGWIHCPNAVCKEEG